MNMVSSMPDLDHQRITPAVTVAGLLVASLACFFGIDRALHALFDSATTYFLHRIPDNQFKLAADATSSIHVQSSTSTHVGESSSSPGDRRSKRKARGRPARVQGISNLGQTCFANVVLQAQSSLDEFVEFVRQSSTFSRAMDGSGKPKEIGKDTQLLRKLDAFFSNLNGKYGSSVSGVAAEAQTVNVEQLMLQLLELLRIRVDKQEDSHEFIIALALEIDRALDLWKRRAAGIFNGLALPKHDQHSELMPIPLYSQRVERMLRSMRSRWNISCKVDEKTKPNAEFDTEIVIHYVDYFLHKMLTSPFKGLSASQTMCLHCQQKSDWLLECFDVISLLLPELQPTSGSVAANLLVGSNMLQLRTGGNGLTSPTNSFLPASTLSPLEGWVLPSAPPSLTISELFDHNFASCNVYGVSCDACTDLSKKKNNTVAASAECRPELSADKSLNAFCCDKNAAEVPLKTTKIKLTKLARIPACVCIHINRTGWSGDAYKRNDRVIFPASINFRRWMLAACVAPSPVIQRDALYAKLHVDNDERLTVNEASVVNNFPTECVENDAHLRHLSGVTESKASPEKLGVNNNGSCEICSVVVHHGSANYGHYTTFRRSASVIPTSYVAPPESRDEIAQRIDNNVNRPHYRGHWVHCDDKFITPVSLCKQVLIANPYLLFYQRSLDK